MAPPGDQDDICPVCKSSRYLNSSMRFLVNPECYHKMCESCVDRIFSHGPHACPIAGCTRTLRKHRFRVQTFDDIRVEREVDIRKRVAAIFNRRQDEFESLREYNDYLNDVEDLTFNLIEGIDVEQTEAKLKSYQAANGSVISHNAAAAAREAQDLSATEEAMRQQTRLSQAAARMTDEQERRAKAEGRQNIIDQLASTSGDADQIAQEGQRISAKRRKDMRDTSLSMPALRPAENGNGAFVIKGLKAAGSSVASKPFDAFGGLALRREYSVLEQDYAWDWLDKAKRDPAIVAGGYSAAEFYSRAMCDAFSGLGVIMGDAPDTIMVDHVI